MLLTVWIILFPMKSVGFVLEDVAFTCMSHLAALKCLFLALSGRV